MPNATYYIDIDDFQKTGKCATIDSSMDWDLESFQGEANKWSTIEKIAARRVLRRKRVISQKQNRERLLTKLEQLKHECKEEGWDGDDATPISQKTIKEAKILMESLPMHIPLPHLVPVHTGTIGLEWRKGEKGKEGIFVLTVRGKGNIHCIVAIGEKTNRAGDEELTTEISPYIERELTSFFYDE